MLTVDEWKTVLSNDLFELKQALGLDEAQWQAYTAKVRPEQEERKHTETQQIPPSGFSSCHPSQRCCCICNPPAY
jgi:hypothetical protein